MSTPPPPTAPEGGDTPFWFADWRPDDVPISEWQLFWNECTANLRALPLLAAQAGAEKRVVEAAKEWRKIRQEGFTPQSQALIEAVDAMGDERGK